MFTAGHYTVALSATLVLAVIDILNSFLVPSEHLRKILRSVWFLLYVLFYLLATLAVCLVFDEQKIINLSYPITWALGMGFGVFLFLQAGVQFNLPWLSGNKEMAVGLKQMAEKWRAYCYLRITEELQTFRNEMKAGLKSKSVAGLLAELERICTEKQFEAYQPLIEEKQAMSEEKLKGFLISAIVTVNSAPLKQE